MPTDKEKMSLRRNLEIAIERGTEGDMNQDILRYLIVEIQSQDKQEFIRSLQEYWIKNHFNEKKITHKIKEAEKETLQGQLKHDPDSYDRKDGLYDRYLFNENQWEFIGRGPAFK